MICSIFERHSLALQACEPGSCRLRREVWSPIQRCSTDPPASTVFLLDQITETGPGTEDQEQYGDEAEQETDGSAFGRGGEGGEPGRVVGPACGDERLRGTGDG